MTDKQIAEATRRDPILSKVLLYASKVNRIEYEFMHIDSVHMAQQVNRFEANCGEHVCYD